MVEEVQDNRVFDLELLEVQVVEVLIILRQHQTVVVQVQPIKVLLVLIGLVE